MQICNVTEFLEQFFDQRANCSVAIPFPWAAGVLTAILILLLLLLLQCIVMTICCCSFLKYTSKKRHSQETPQESLVEPSTTAASEATTDFFQSLKITTKEQEQSLGNGTELNAENTVEEGTYATIDQEKDIVYAEVGLV